MNRLMLLGFLLATATASAGTLQLGEPTVENDRITVPVLLGGDLSGGVGAMDFRFRYNAEALQPVSVAPGAAAASADKRVMSNMEAPGEYAVVMMGFNQAACGPGEAVRIVLQRLHSSDQNWELELVEPTLSSIDGHMIESRILPAAIEPESAEQPEGEENERTGPSVAQPATEPADAADSSGAPVSGAVAYGAVGAGPAAEGASTSAAAEKLNVALNSAREVRRNIATPPGINEEAAEGAPGPETANEDQGEETGNTAAGRGRTETASIIRPEVPKGNNGLRNHTVEPQPTANVAVKPPATAGEGGKLLFYAVVAVVAFVLAGAVYVRRSRLIG